MPEADKLFLTDEYWGGHRRGDDCPRTAVVYPEEARAVTYTYSDNIWKKFLPSYRRGLSVTGYTEGVFDARNLQPGTILGLHTEFKNVGEMNGPDILRYNQTEEFGIVSPGHQEGSQNHRLIVYTPTDNPRKTIRIAGETVIQTGVVNHTRGYVAGREVDTLKRVGIVFPIGLFIGEPPPPPHQPPPPPGSGGSRRRRVFDLKDYLPKWRPTFGVTG